MQVSQQTNAQLIEEAMLHRAQWTTEQLESVRAAARELVRTHERIDLGHRIITTVDGKALWALMGALDRANFDRNRRV